MHDIGKVGIPDQILLKPGKLTFDEFNVMKTHTTIGADILRAVDEQYSGNKFIAVGIEIAQYHHERWDGSGYPVGLIENKIPLSGRILALADVYDALTSKRVYKEEIEHAQACEIIREARGSHFEPLLVDCFLMQQEGFNQVNHNFKDS